VLNTNNQDSEDGLLQSYEIASLDINTDLTVLSACNTGLGKLYSGEGMIGLNQAFFIAGSKSLCLTLWSISDASTSLFMNYFYKNLSTEMTKREALRQAKLSLMNNEKYSSPYYWAPYILSGAYN
jgi:CHAT domain-containing protein